VTVYRLITLRPPDPQGSGDSRRAQSIVRALEGAGHTVVLAPILAPGQTLFSSLLRPTALMHLIWVLLRYGFTRPLQWVAVQALVPGNPSGELSPHQTAFYVTSRVAPPEPPAGFVIDFVDSLAANARGRSHRGPGVSAFWRREARLLERWERELAAKSMLATAVSETECATIAPNVAAVPLEIGPRLRPSPEAEARGYQSQDPTVLFAGNLYYHPNAEAARWVLEVLTPALVSRGWRREQVVLAGRRPGRALAAMAERAGATLLADVPDLQNVIEGASVCLAPLLLGSGIQFKVLDALQAGVPVAMSAQANRGIGLSDSDMVRVVERKAEPFCDAIDILLTRRNRVVPADVHSLLASASPAAVQHRWRSLTDAAGR